MRRSSAILIALCIAFSIAPAAQRGHKHRPTIPTTAGEFTSPKVDQFKIKPSTTDPAITQFDNDHFIFIDKNVTPLNQLVVFLPGTGSKPSKFQGFCQIAAQYGYHVICLMYPDGTAADTVSKSSDKNAFLNFRLEVIEGKHLSTNVSVDRTNCIENRLIKLLQYLDGKHSKENWGQYLTSDGDIKWSKIAIAGMSQGAGNAALIATLHECARAVLFGGPKDFDKYSNLPAAWYTTPKTPLDRIFAFDNEQDHQGCSFPEQLQNWKAMGLYSLGKPYLIDGANPPYGNSHLLETNYPGTPIPSEQAHTSLITDAATPKTSSGGWLFGRVWVYMLTADAARPRRRDFSVHPTHRKRKS